MKLGNMEDAKLIYRRRKSGFGPLPKGWKKLGAGSYRDCYLSPDGVVYKVQMSNYIDANLSEAENYKRLKGVKLPRGWRIAKTKEYCFDDVCVIAMEYIKGRHELKTDDDYEEWFIKIGATEAFKVCNMYDLHEENFVITPKGQKVIVDLAA